MLKNQNCLFRVNTVLLATALVAASASAGAETVVASIQAAGSGAVEARAAASVLDGQLLPALSSSADRVLSLLAGFGVAVLQNNGHTSGQFLDLNDETDTFSKGSSFAIFEHSVLGSAYAATDPWADEAALVRVAAAPEPSTYALMFGSMAMVGSTARRRRNDALGWMASRRREDVVA
jgi:hypothetical protein